LNSNVRLTLGGWQWNASIVGFINIVGWENVRIEKDTVEFSPEVLEEFEEKFFAYLIHTYEKTLSWYKIVSFEDKLYDCVENDFEDFDLNSLKSMNNYIKDVKRYIKSSSYQSAYELINFDMDMLSLEKQLTVIKEPKSQQHFNEDKAQILMKVKLACSILQQIIAYCESPGGKRYIRAKNIIYTVVNNAWSGVSFLNRQAKIKDVYTDYKTYFVDPAIDYLKCDKHKYKYNCFICNEPIKDMSNDLSFLNATGFDVARKSSHVWNFQNDIAICPVCKLVYSCLPAGMTYAYDRGIYVNANVSLQNARNINFNIKTTILNSLENGMRSVYHALVAALHEKENNTVKYELADVQVVRYENSSYRFNILSRKMQEIIVLSEPELKHLIKTNFNENGQNVKIYDEVIASIFNNQNLFSLIHRMIYYKLSDSAKCYFNGKHVSNVLMINQRLYQSLGGMAMEKVYRQDEENSVLVKNAKNAGYHLRKKYHDKEADNKLPGICYRLLNALKTSNENMFMDVILNCYLYVKSQVPKVITDVLGNEKSFSTMGYALVAGLIDGQDTNGRPENTTKGEEK
jgi:CRISPR-associated protein Cst1